MLPPGLNTPREVTLYYDSLYHSLIESDQAVPFLYPWAGVGALVVFSYLLIDHRQSQYLAGLRYAIFAFLFAFQTWCILTNKARHPAAAFGVGLLSAWGTVWVASLILVNDCQENFVRLNRVPKVHATDPTGSTSNGSVANGSVIASEDSESIKWQEFPAHFVDRFDWVADVFSNFRGVGWNWQISVIPPPPKSTESERRSITNVTTSKVGIRRFGNRNSLLKFAITRLLIGYLALDLVKVLMHNDGYFWGYINAPPPQYLPDLVRNSYAAVKSYRLLIGLAGLYIALFEAFAMGPLFFCGILGPQRLGVRGEAWMNPLDMFGSFKCVLDNGLAGWWGGWWHQTFRFAFEAHSTVLLAALSTDKRSNMGRLVSLVTAFFLSGCVHAAGSYTQLGDTRPLMGPLRFFLLQPLGILCQIYLVHVLSKFKALQKTPKALRQIANFTFVHTWLYFTAPLLMDDFAKGGVFLFEPVAFSPLRALQLGAKDDTWFCWWNGVMFWHSGEHWWNTGIAL